MNNQPDSEPVGQESRSKIKDQKCRLSPAMRLNLAQAYAAKGDLETAEKHVAAAYAEKPDLKDGYARCAWQYYWPLKQYDKVIEWMERDLEQRTEDGVVIPSLPRDLGRRPSNPDTPTPSSSRLDNVCPC